MAQDAARRKDLGGCQRCGGMITATHMLTKTYRIDDRGQWHRRLDDFIEDVVVVCAACGDEPMGRFEANDGTFTFVPAPRNREHREQ